MNQQTLTKNISESLSKMILSNSAASCKYTDVSDANSSEHSIKDGFKNLIAKVNNE
jgi:hypothetical protein